MYIRIIDKLTGEVVSYDVYDSPPRLVLVEETNEIQGRFIYTVSRVAYDNAVRVAFADFAPIAFFDLATEPISDHLWNWLYKSI